MYKHFIYQSILVAFNVCMNIRTRVETCNPLLIQKMLFVFLALNFLIRNYMIRNFLPVPRTVCYSARDSTYVRFVTIVLVTCELCVRSYLYLSLR
jgi:hypothetical protein